MTKVSRETFGNAEYKELLAEYVRIRNGVHTVIAKLDKAGNRLELASLQPLNQKPGANFIQGNIGASHMASQAAGLLRELIR